jgi:hypothetical protein
VIVQHPAEVRFGRNKVKTAQHLTLHNANNTKGYGPKKSMEQEMLNGFGQLHLNKLPQTLLPKNHLGGFKPFLCSFLFG